MTRQPSSFVIPYLRQSLGREGETEDTSLSLEAQEREIHSWAVRNGYSHVEEAVRDWDLSGVDPYRPGLLELRSRVRPGAVVAVWRWDRLGRKLTLSESMVDALEALGADVVSVTQGSDRFARQVYGMVAESEYRAHSARMTAMKQAVARRGGFKGGITPYGYRQAHTREVTDQDGKVSCHGVGPLVPDEKEAPIVREIFERISRGEGVFPIARDLGRRGVPTRRGGTWGATHIRRIAANPTYIGSVTNKGEIVCEDAHEAIVDRDLWLRVQAILTNPIRPRATRTKREREPSWTAGYVVHACGAAMYSIPIIKRSNGKQHYSQHYACATSYKEATCGIESRHIAQSKVEAAARACLASDLAAIADVDTAITRARDLAGATEVAEERAKLEAQLAEAERVYDRARAWYVQSSQELEWMQEQLARYEAVRKEVGGKLAQLPAEPDRAEYENAWEHLRSLGESIAVASPTDLRALLVIVGQIVVAPYGPDATSIAIRYQPPYRDLIDVPRVIVAPKKRPLQLR